MTKKQEFETDTSATGEGGAEIVWRKHLSVVAFWLLEQKFPGLPAAASLPKKERRGKRKKRERKEKEKRKREGDCEIACRVALLI